MNGRPLTDKDRARRRAYLARLEENLTARSDRKNITFGTDAISTRAELKTATPAKEKNA